MERSTRRGVLLAAGGFVLTGTTAGRIPAVGGTDTTGTTDASEARTADSSEARSADTSEARQSLTASFEGTVKLRPGEHQSWKLAPTGEATLSYDLVVRWGPKVDAILFSAEEYRAYVKGYRARYVTAGTAFGTQNAPGVSATLAPGEYYFVVDNVDWSDGFPTDATESRQGKDTSQGVPGDASKGSKPLGVDLTFTLEE